MNERLVQTYLPMLQKSKRRELLVSSVIFLALFVLSLFLFFKPKTAVRLDLAWPILWSCSLLFIGLYGLFLYKITKSELIRPLQISFYCMIPFSLLNIFKLLGTCILLSIFSKMTNFDVFCCFLEFNYYALCIIIALRGAKASKILIDSMNLQNESYKQNAQMINPAMEVELNPSPNISGHALQARGVLNYYSATNNSLVMSGHINQGD